MDKKVFSIDEALKFGWNTMKTNFWFFFGILIVAWIVVYVPSLIGNLLRDKSSLLYLIFMLVSWAIQVMISIGLIRISLKFIDGGKPEFNDLFRFQGFFWRYLGGSLLVGLIVVVGILLFVIPGIVWAIMFQFFGFLIIDKNLSIMDSVRQSGNLTKTVRWKLLGFGLLLMLINYLGLIVLLVGLFATIPTTMLAHAWVYRKLLGQTESGESLVNS
ncbi:hypothetical protein AMJ83_10340 [candidate division WOR_3 bacterium SM23_42]|uniref:Glycerophosphoryl diester phosphodiesterase membrane domain-containing protein n=1 Tax=candidate division WOR_3 bacterium SM23_42 TaxID=1703779 RepID=A0A0S8FPL7_UNCW3|nr:MAG: hypothetical protein AMJ83_10340 [candidate division WOR_3 bacterium SM23_42]